MKNERILVIDDDKYIRNACSEFLISEGYIVSTAEDGEHGLELFKKNHYELVIVDFVMPGMDGIEVLKNVKAISPRTDVIIVTAHGTIENAVKAIRYGAYDYLTKNYDINELDLVVKRCLEKQRIEKQFNELDILFNSMADGALKLDRDLKILKINHAAEALFGSESGEVSSENILSLTADFTSSIQLDSFSSINENVIQFQLIREKGKMLYLGVVSTRLFNEYNNHTGYVWIIRDITAEKRENKYKNDFLSLISHKIRTPLTAIVGYSSLLSSQLKDSMDKKTSTALNTIRKQGDLLNEIVESIVRFTIIDCDVSGLRYEPVSLKDIVSAWLQKNNDMLLDQNVKLILEDSVDNLPYMKADRSKMLEVLDNLAKNAIKFNSKTDKKIIISAGSDKDYIYFNVADNGNGIPPEEFKKIFNKFYQIDEYDTGQIRGMGLGLALVEKIVNMHGGQVDVKSKIGEGSIFTVKILRNT